MLVFKLYSDGTHNFLCVDVPEKGVPTTVNPCIFLQGIWEFTDIEGINADMYEDTLANPGARSFNPARPQRMVKWTKEVVLEGVIDRDHDGDVTMDEIKLIKAPGQISSSKTNIKPKSKKLSFFVQWTKTHEVPSLR